MRRTLIVFAVFLALMPVIALAARPQPSYQQGYARSASESAKPALWRGLRGAWVSQLGPTGTQLLDISGNGRHGAFVDMVANDWLIRGEAGGYVINMADVDQDQVNIPHDPEFLFTSGNQEHTFVMTFRATNGWISGDGLMGMYTTSNRAWVVWTSSSVSDLAFRRYYDAGNFEEVIINNSSIYDGRWIWFAVTTTAGGNLDIYGGSLGRGGALVRATTVATRTYASNSNTSPLVIGNYRSDAARNSRIEFGHVLIYNRVLSQNELEDSFRDHLGFLRLKDEGAVAAEEVAAPSGEPTQQIIVIAWNFFRKVVAWVKI
jgi:hypothetical protein